MSETTDCAKRAVRIKALRAKAASTEYPAERDTFNAKADELQAKNDAVGYVDPEERSSRSSIFGAAFDDFFRQTYQEAASAEHLRRYQTWLRQQETGRRPAQCVHEWERLEKFNQSVLCECQRCGKREWRVDAPGGTASSYHEYTQNATTGEWEESTTPRTKRSHKTNPTGERRTRVDHSQCYAEGLHDKSKAGRASCRRGTV